MLVVSRSTMVSERDGLMTWRHRAVDDGGERVTTVAKVEEDSRWWLKLCEGLKHLLGLDLRF